MNEMTV